MIPLAFILGLILGKELGEMQAANAFLKGIGEGYRRGLPRT